MVERPTDEEFMRLALGLARRGLGFVSPNPMVGAVIVRDGRIIARGYHHYFGGDHAEVDALKHATEDVRGATLYVTLEPCRHWGKTPPCTDAIIRSNIARVVVGMLDPFPQMQGRSIELLNRAGIATTVGVLEEACRTLNEPYLKWVTTGIPYVTVKWAQTLDGKIALASGVSRWISSPPSLRLAHRLRATHDAVLVGIGTVLADDPQLTVRLVKGRNPVRIVLDSHLRIPPTARVLADQDKARTIVVTTPSAPPERISVLVERGVEVLTVPAERPGRVDLGALLKTLGARQISSVLVEGGAGIITSFLGLADRTIAIIAPKLVGRGKDVAGVLEVDNLDRATGLTFRRVYRSGDDVVLEAGRRI
ncbi:MAG: bifunctional diaminohydroxyphosphoribosylaminopyrimidine deaminase/5-amino-6-(5-phosphoribosylamino)uracil reductase RibD [Dehalococcoidales bacterium]|nr:bifunctional diaminohydroxyphosphoribosylaminopyrimidine deaminase/5-amino-6-(5-phosphoribosylamino)uracil reductase RibD [Dehalococcoidales bacterium]